MNRVAQYGMFVSLFVLLGSNVTLAQSGATGKTTPAPAAAPPAPAPAKQASTVPEPESLLLLVRTTLIALNQANQSGDYGVLHKISGPGLRSKLTVEQLAAAFANLRTQQIDLSPVVAITPQLDEAPAIVGDGVLRLVGFFPTTPMRIKFQMLFQPAEGNWRLLGMDVTAVKLPTPAAAPAPEAAAAKKAEPKKAPEKKQ